MISETQESRLPLALLALRVTVFIVFLLWTLDKFVNPGHAGAVYERFYLIGGLGELVFLIIGLAEMVLILAFLAGVYKRWTYGVVLVIHAISTLSTWQLYLDPFNNLLFFAAWPMLGACWALYLLRDADTLMTLNLGNPDPASG
ncbi:MAG: hypothetical protein WD002_03345 [Pseudomonadales bacterium]